jgi:hypothetical protein
LRTRIILFGFQARATILATIMPRHAHAATLIALNPVEHFFAFHAYRIGVAILIE